MKRLERLTKSECEDGTKKRFALLIVTFFVLLFLISIVELPLTNAEDDPARTSKMLRFVPGEILIKFKDDADIGEIAQELSRRREPFRTITKTSTLDNLNDRFRVRKIKRLFRSKDGRNLKGLTLSQETAREFRERAKKRFLEQVKNQIKNMKFREVKAGETLALPGGLELKVTKKMVNANRKLLFPIVEGQELPTPLTVLLVKGEWKVDASSLIAARLAAKRVRERRAPDKPEAGDDE